MHMPPVLLLCVYGTIDIQITMNYDMQNILESGVNISQILLNKNSPSWNIPIVLLFGING